MGNVINHYQEIEIRMMDYENIVDFINGKDIDIDISYKGDFSKEYSYSLNIKSNSNQTVYLDFILFKNGKWVYKRELLKDIDSKYVCLFFALFYSILDKNYHEFGESTLKDNEEYNKFIIRFKLQSFNKEVKPQKIEHKYNKELLSIMDRIRLRDIIRYHNLGNEYELMSVIDACVNNKELLITDTKRFLRERLEYYGYEKDIITDFNNYDDNIYIKTGVYTIMKILWDKKLTKEDYDNYEKYNYMNYLDYLQKELILK